MELNFQYYHQNDFHYNDELHLRVITLTRLRYTPKLVAGGGIEPAICELMRLTCYQYTFPP